MELSICDHSDGWAGAPLFHMFSKWKNVVWLTPKHTTPLPTFAVQMPSKQKFPLEQSLSDAQSPHKPNVVHCPLMQ